MSGGVGPLIDVGLPPKVKPAPNEVSEPLPFCNEVVILRPEGKLTLEPAEGIGIASTSEWEGNSNSCAPSSEMVLFAGKEPGRGKKIERLRECNRE
jgi:hypothetical protein